MRVGFIGAGSMAGAMARGWARAMRDGAEGAPQALYFSDADYDRAKALADEVGGSAAPTNSELAAHSDLVLLAVKPAALAQVAREIGHDGPPIVSMLGATSIADVEAHLPGATVSRIVPNQPVEVGRGVICLAVAGGGDEEPPTALLGLLGAVVALPEEELDAALAIMSCTPAYLAEVAGALIDAGTAHGLDRGLATRLVSETLAGTGEMLATRDPGQIRGAVATPGGITEAGLEVLERAGAVKAFRDAVDTTMGRMGR